MKMPRIDTTPVPFRPIPSFDGVVADRLLRSPIAQKIIDASRKGRRSLPIQPPLDHNNIQNTIMRRFGNITGFVDNTSYIENQDGVTTTVSVNGGRIPLSTWLTLENLEEWVAEGDYFEFQESKAFTIWT